jgi:hypothetical protein
VGVLLGRRLRLQGFEKTRQLINIVCTDGRDLDVVHADHPIPAIHGKNHHGCPT